MTLNNIEKEKQRRRVMQTRSFATLLREFIDQEKLIKALKLENYQHMQDKVKLQDQIYQMQMLDIAKKAGDNGEKATDKW